MSKRSPVATKDKKPQSFKYSVETFFATFFSAHFIISVINLLSRYNDEVFYNSLDFIQAEGAGIFKNTCIFIVLIMAGLTALDYFLPKLNLIPHTLLISASALALILVSKSASNQYYMYYAVMIVMAIVMIYATEKKCLSFIKSEFHPAIMWSAVGVIALVFGFYVGAIGVYRYLSYSTPNFDFGLFVNMFHNMAETGLPNSTSERDMLLSHFAVHFSPIYYLMLPFYFIFRSPITLQILQAVVVYSGIVPIVLIAKKKGLSAKLTVLISAVYAAYPAVSAGCFYDIHENCFLIPLLLWVFYFFERENYILLGVFSLLTLFIKEDAFIYLFIFGLYVLLSRKKWKIAIPMLIVPVLYFLTVSSLMEQYGTGIMSSRFNNMIFDKEDGLIGVVKTVVLNPGYALSQLLVSSKDNADKIRYLIQLLLPLAFMPFFTKKVSRFILITPILINTLTMYQYQPNINFQYSFGITAFLFYIAILNISEIQPSFVRSYLPRIAIIASVLMFAIAVVPTYNTYSKKYEDNKEVFERMDYALEDVLPEDVSVTCSSMLLAHIADRDEIYELKYHVDENKNYKADTEYIVLDVRASYKKDSLAAADYFRSKGYTEFYHDDGAILILVDKNFND